MTDERRYDEKEVAEIFEAATDSRTGTRADTTSRDGLTLRELHGIAAEVGIPSESVTRAAHRLDARQAPDTRSWMGVPVGVGRTVDLPRPLTDLEWQRLVANLRETFNATGRVEDAGGLRQWWNGNLRVLVEPTGSGYRLRMTTTKGDFRTLTAMGFSILAMALMLFFVGGLSSSVDAAGPVFLGLVGMVTLGANLGRMPSWARTRSRQMDQLATEVTEWVALPPAGDNR